MLKIVVVGLGGFLGANLRFWVGTWAVGRYGDGFPWGTLIVNLVGCFGLALFATLIQSRYEVSESTRLLVATGFLGALTTFSTFSVESFNLYQNGQTMTAAIYLLSSLILGLFGVVLGTALGNM